MPEIEVFVNGKKTCSWEPDAALEKFVREHAAQADLRTYAVRLVITPIWMSGERPCKICKVRAAQTNDPRCESCIAEQHAAAERAAGVQ